jgi:hypothetical protein
MAAYFSPQGSSREEAILNVIKALQLFDNYQEKIFSAVEERYGECKTQIQGLNSRLDMLDQKIEFLRQVIFEHQISTFHFTILEYFRTDITHVATSVL